MIHRDLYIKKIRDQFNVHNVVAILGPRQCGKTTLSKDYIKDIAKNQQEFSEENYFDLENPYHLARLDNPMLTLSALRGLVIIDEIQRRPDIFPIIRVLNDDDNLKQQYLILGSASRDLIKQSSETLAGRIGYVELCPFSLEEVEDFTKLWIRGGFPKSFLAENAKFSDMWKQEYIRTFLERDIPNLGINIPSLKLRKFWYMLTHYHGNLFNASELGRSLGISYNTAISYLDILVGTFMIRQLQPWHENLKKRQVKASKIYFRDSGLLHTLMDIDSIVRLELHPKLGASWEGYALEEIIRKHNKNPEECFFWSTYSGAEIDLMFFESGKKIGFEFKYCDAPRLTRSMQVALTALELSEIRVIYPGSKNYRIHDKISVISLRTYISNYNTDY